MKYDTFLSPVHETTNSIGRKAKINDYSSFSELNTQRNLLSSVSNISREVPLISERTVHDISDNPTMSENYQLESLHSSMSDFKTGGLATSSKVGESDFSKDPPALFHQMNEFPTPSLTKMHIVKLPRNKVSASLETDHMRRRASSFGEVTVSRVKSARPVHRSFRDPSVKVIRSNH